MKVLLLIFLLFLFSCSGLNKSGVYKDYNRCQLILKQDDKVEKEISLGNLPNETGLSSHEGLWCSEDLLRGAKKFTAYDESWVVIFFGNETLKVKAYPIKNENSKRAQYRSLKVGLNGCDIIQRRGEVFKFEEILAQGGQSFSLKLACND